jgi:UV DNA damage repair endonuclease
MSDITIDAGSMEFNELESRFGKDNAYTILRTLERFEGVTEARVSRLSHEERLKNVFSLMKENMRYQTRH